MLPYVIAYFEGGLYGSQGMELVRKLISILNSIILLYVSWVRIENLSLLPHLSIVYKEQISSVSYYEDNSVSMLAFNNFFRFSSLTFFQASWLSLFSVSFLVFPSIAMKVGGYILMIGGKTSRVYIHSQFDSGFSINSSLAAAISEMLWYTWMTLQLIFLN